MSFSALGYSNAGNVGVQKILVSNYIIVYNGNPNGFLGGQAGKIGRAHV